MPESLSPRQAGLAAAANYRQYKSYLATLERQTGWAEHHRREADYEQSRIEKNQSVLNGSEEGLKSLAELSIKLSEKSIIECLERIGYYGVSAERMGQAVELELTQGKLFYRAHNGAIQDAAVLDAALDNVQINVQTFPSP